MNRIILFYRSYILYFLFIVLSILSVAGSFTPIFSLSTDNPNITLGRTEVRILDISYDPNIIIFGQSIGTTNFGIFIFVVFAIIFLIGSFFYLTRRRALAKTLYDLLLLFNLAQLIALLIRYVQLLFHVSTYPDDRISIVLGNYVYILAGVIVVGLIVRYFYIGIERRNSVYIYRKSA